MTLSTVNKPIPRAVKFADDMEWLKILPSIDNSFSLMRNLLKGVSTKYPGVDVLAKKKRHTSATEKTVRKNCSYSQLGDLVKGLILTDNLQESIAVANYLVNNFTVVKWEAKTGTLENPYCGVFHIDILLGNLTCEIQVMPRKTSKVKKLSNSFYKTGRAEESSHLWKDVENFNDCQRAILGI